MHIAILPANSRRRRRRRRRRTKAKVGICFEIKIYLFYMIQHVFKYKSLRKLKVQSGTDRSTNKRMSDEQCKCCAYAAYAQIAYIQFS